jgi:hypothetical protein
MAVLRRRTIAAHCGALLALASWVAPIRAEPRVDLRPERPRGGFAQLIDAFRAASARAPRMVRVETSPPFAELELAYARNGVELRSARGRAPLEVVLPSLAESEAGDFAAIVARLPGWHTGERVLAIAAVGDVVRIELEPLPTEVVGAWLLDLAGRARLTLQSAQPLEVRLHATERGWRVVAANAVLAPAALAALRAARGRTLRSVEARALGDDLAIELDAPVARAAAAELRATRETERVRPLHLLQLQVVAADGGDVADAALRAAFAELERIDVSGCAAEFDRALREALAAEPLARALTRREVAAEVAGAIRRVGELSPDARIQLSDGTPLAPSQPLEHERALAQPERVLGLLAALRALVAHLEPEPERHGAFAALVAPELSHDALATALSAAELAERACASAP